MKRAFFFKTVYVEACLFVSVDSLAFYVTVFVETSANV